MKQPNILLITCHDLGDYLGCYGTPVGTPNIDSLSRNGVQLCNHFSTAPICSPARGSILTGCYPHTNGLMGLVHRGWELNVQPFPLFCGTTAGIPPCSGFSMRALSRKHWAMTRSLPERTPTAKMLSRFLRNGFGNEKQQLPFMRLWASRKYTVWA